MQGKWAYFVHSQGKGQATGGKTEIGIYLTQCRKRDAWRAAGSSFTGAPDVDKRRGQRAAKRRASTIITIGDEHNTPEELGSELSYSTRASSSETMAAGKYIGK